MVLQEEELFVELLQSNESQSNESSEWSGDVVLGEERQACVHVRVGVFVPLHASYEECCCPVP